MKSLNVLCTGKGLRRHRIRYDGFDPKKMSQLKFCKNFVINKSWSGSGSDPGIQQQPGSGFSEYGSEVRLNPRDHAKSK
jgi:hypothetical protein